MNEPIEAFVGVDWGSRMHFTCLVAGDGTVVGECKVGHSGAELHELVTWLCRRAGTEPTRIAVAIEVPHGPVVDTLMEAGFQVYTLNPKQLDRFRDRYTMAGAKDDRRDALVLAQSLRTDRARYRLLEPVAPALIELREWSRIAENCAAERIRIANRLRDLLWRYYPQILEVSDDWTSPWVLNLWTLVPTPAKAKTVRLSSVATLLARARVRRWDAAGLLADLRQKSIPVAAGVTEACVAHVRLLIASLRHVTEQQAQAHARLDALNRALASQTGEKDGEVLQSLPGIGRVILSTLLSEASDAIRRRDPHALRCLSGVVPVTRRSGKMHVVAMRQACSRRLRTALFHWARVAVMRDRHCRARYAALRQRGHSNARALRSIGSRLIDVACAMLRAGELFDRDRMPQAMP